MHWRGSSVVATTVRTGSAPTGYVMTVSAYLRSIGRRCVPALLACTGLVVGAAPTAAHDLTERFSVGGVLSGAYQCQDVSHGTIEGSFEVDPTEAVERQAPATCRGALPFQPEISFRPNARNEFFAKFGFAWGDGLNPVSPFVQAPWAADLESDVENINDRGRDHLLTAWYKHTFRIRENESVAVTFGIIDATDYLDENAYANDEFTQFMNETFSNAPSARLPSYDRGGAVEIDRGNWSLNGVVMAVGPNDDGNKFTFYGVQLGRKFETRLGEGNYRAVAVGSNSQFLDPTGTSKKNLAAVMLSFDQKLGERVGAFLRIGWQKRDASVTYGSLYSGGLALFGKSWGRENDTIGFGYGYLNGGNVEIGGTHVTELYYKMGLGERFSLTADVQYMKDKTRGVLGPKGLIYGLRGTVKY